MGDIIMFSSQILLGWSRKIMPKRRAEWLEAMEIEISEIADKPERWNFAFGCFKTALLYRAQTRRGLNYIARAVGAFLIFAVSAAGILFNADLRNQPETVAIAWLVVGLCLFYMIASGLLIASLRGLKIYAGIGFSFAMAGWVYFTIARPKFETVSIPIDFLATLSIEAAGFMAGLFLFAIYLNWLYVSEVDSV